MKVSKIANHNWISRIIKYLKVFYFSSYKYKYFTIFNNNEIINSMIMWINKIAIRTRV